MLTGVPGFDRIDPHNMLAQIVWAAGLFGICWLGYFAYLVFSHLRVFFEKRNLRDSWAQYGISVAGGLFGWFLCGMAHTIIATGVSWLFFGTALRMSKVLRQRERFRLVA